MGLIKIDKCKEQFAEDCGGYQQMVKQAETWEQPSTGGTGNTKIGQRKVEIIAGLALLGIHQAWEDLMEGSFIRYMCGAKSNSGYQPVLLKPKENSIHDALKVILGRSSYLNWSEANTIDRARTYFKDGKPYSDVFPYVTGTLKDLVAIRNRFAHRSEHSKNEFRQVVRSFLGFVPRGITPGRFLLKEFNGIRILDHFGNNLVVAASRVVPGN